jgi:hypothetical protein
MAVIYTVMNLWVPLKVCEFREHSILEFDCSLELVCRFVSYACKIYCAKMGESVITSQ